MRNRGVEIPRLFVDPLISTKGRYAGSGRNECARNQLPSRNREPGFVAKEQSAFSACLVLLARRTGGRTGGRSYLCYVFSDDKARLPADTRARGWFKTWFKTEDPPTGDRQSNQVGPVG